MKGTMPLYTILLDHVTLGTLSPYQEISLPQSEKISTIIRESVPFDISNLVLKNEEQYIGKMFIDLFRALPVCVPPYLHMWFEYRCGGEYIAVSVTTARRAPESTHPIWTKSGDSSVTAVPPGGFLSRGITFREAGHGMIAQMMVLCEAIFDESGSILANDDSVYVTRFMPESWVKTSPLPVTPEQESSECDFAMTCFYDCLFACALMHCRNVGQVDNTLPRAMARARERKQFPKVIFKTLVVDPGKTPRKPDPRAGEHIQRRQHIVRGHFAEYGCDPVTGQPFRWPDGTPKGKLFGRLDGRYWIPEMVKGDSETGFVVKDYKIKGRAS
jgi:hypothetical protein